MPLSIESPKLGIVRNDAEDRQTNGLCITLLKKPKSAVALLIASASVSSGVMPGLLLSLKYFSNGLFRSGQDAVPLPFESRQDIQSFILKPHQVEPRQRLLSDALSSRRRSSTFSAGCCPQRCICPRATTGSRAETSGFSVRFAPL